VQLLVLAAGRPDVLVLQECDHYGSLARALAELGYASQLPGKSGAYSPAHLQGFDTSTPEGAAQLQQHVQDEGHAFSPNLGSTAMRLMLKRQGLVPQLTQAAADSGLGDRFAGGSISRRAFVGLPGGSGPLLQKAGLEPAAIDDDGVAIFWRTDRFRAESIQVHLLPSGDNIALEVGLRTLEGDRPLVVVGSHLSSGGKPADEEKRVREEVAAEGGLSAVLHTCQGGAAGEVPVIASLDANSHPQLRTPDGTTSVWQSLHAVLGASVWDAYFDAEGKERQPEATPISTNKFRGPATSQARKMGDHALHLIDHIFFNPRAFELQGHVFRPVHFASPSDALPHMLPTLAMPSDHLPVVVDLTWVDDGKAANA